MVKEPQKKNLSSIQVLKTLNLLMEGDYSMSELIQKLNENEDEPIFNNSVVSKYINTCRQCGLKIEKIHNKYFVTSLPFGMKLTNEESDLLQKLKDVVTGEMSSKTQDKYQKFIDKLNRYANKQITRIEKKVTALVLEVFERAISNRRRIKLLFKNRYELSGIPITISTENGKVFFHVFCNNRIRMIDAGRLSGIQILDETYFGHLNELNIVFTLKGRLAKRYELREDEQMINSSELDGTITVSNECYNSEMLLSRLMRYDELCEVNTPKEIRHQMKTLIDDTLKNYGIE